MYDNSAGAGSGVLQKPHVNNVLRTWGGKKKYNNKKNDSVPDIFPL